jgi:hypothetical protein
MRVCSRDRKLIGGIRDELCETIELVEWENENRLESLAIYVVRAKESTQLPMK